MQRIDINQVPKGSNVCIKGLVAYSRLLTPRTETEKANLGPYATNYTLVLDNVQIIPETPGQYNIAEQYVAGLTYKGKTDGIDKYSFDKNVLGNISVLHTPDGHTAQPIERLEGELKKGLEVTLVLNVYYSQQWSRNGLGLSTIVVNGPIQYYTGDASVDNVLSRLGLAVDPNAKIGTTSFTAPAQNAAPVDVSMEPLEGPYAFMDEPVQQAPTGQAPQGYVQQATAGQAPQGYGQQAPAPQGYNQNLGGGNPNVQGNTFVATPAETVGITPQDIA